MKITRIVKIKYEYVDVTYEGNPRTFTYRRYFDGRWEIKSVAGFWRNEHPTVSAALEKLYQEYKANEK